ncbi:hypothetical protein PLESTB_001686500 [Pleodorina starrii]|uniref:Reverse transcriptase domain-containing protein n=1 Tax=Pleodorina starrii TaxID=330485 RepID=A0A9W6BZ13_9CHLO|nr:hypothetical protein PLESTB_001686500 [Pleodorina starrii]
MGAPVTPLHARVTERVAAWKAIGADARTLHVLKHGVPVEFLGGRPPPAFELPSFPVDDAQRRWWLETEEPRLVALGAISRVDPARSVDHVVNAFCVPKPGSGSWRLVVNLKRMNVAQKAYKCRYESLRTLRRMGIQDSWMVKVDLADAFYHIPIRPADRRYFVFRFCGVLYEMNALPMGWLNSPYWFTKIMRNVVRFWRDPLAAVGKGRRHLSPPLPPHEFFPKGRGGRPARLGARVLPYLDDFLFVFASREQAELGARWVRESIEFLGLSCHPTKCQWEPSQSVYHLGITVNTADGLFEVPAEKLAKLRRLAVGLRVTAKKNRRLVQKRELAKLCGFAQSVKLALTPAPLFLRNFYDDMKQPVGWSGRVRLSRSSLRDLDWWADIPTRHCSAAIHLGPAAVELSVDASRHSWGAVLNGRTARGYWSTLEYPVHINWKELRAVRHAFESFLPYVRQRVVLIKEDNTCTQAVLGRLSSRSPAMHAEMKLLWQFLQEHSIVLQVERVASADNEADAASRWVDRDDYRLHPRFFRLLERQFGPHDVDLFATHINAHLPRFFSRHHCPGSSGVNALLQPWAGFNAYGCPPLDPDFMMALVQKVREERACVTLVVPYWTAQAWWQQLMELATDLVFLPSNTALFAPGEGGSGSFLLPPQWQVVAVRVQW